MGGVFIEVVFYNNDFAVLVKPVGLDSEKQVPQELSNELKGPFFAVHRLDKNVGGVMVYARNKVAAAKLSECIKRGEMIKEYVALVEGETPTCAEWEDLLWKDSSKNKVYVVKRMRGGVKEARLEFKRVAFDGNSYVKIRLYTGRSHQIRVQFASRGFPLVGDKKYGSRKEASSPMLFSYKISFVFDGEEYSFEKTPDWFKF